MRALLPLFLGVLLVLAFNVELREKVIVKARRPRVLAAFLALALMTTVYPAYKKHCEWFGHHRSSQELSDQILWHVVQGVLFVGKEGAAKLLCAAFVLTTSVLACSPLVWRRLEAMWQRSFKTA